MDVSLGYGGLPIKEKLMYVFAYTRTGKTYWLTNFIRVVNQKNIRRGILFSMEMSKVSIFHRLLQPLLKMHYKEMAEHIQKNPDDVYAALEKAKYLSQLKIIDGFCTIRQIRAYIEMYRPEVVYIDHFHIIPYEGRAASADQQYKEMCNQLMQIRSDYGVLLVVLAQTRKDAAGRSTKVAPGSVPPQVDEMYGSIFISASADYILSLGRPELNEDCPPKYHRTIVGEWCKLRDASPDTPQKIVWRYDPKTSLYLEDHDQ